jgi:hypothetical protein
MILLKALRPSSRNELPTSRENKLLKGMYRCPDLQPAIGQQSLFGIASIECWFSIFKGRMNGTAKL